MDKSIQILYSLIGNPLIVLLVIVAVAVFVQIYMIQKQRRVKNREIVDAKELDELDTCLEEFYIPLRERFQYSKLVTDTTAGWMKNGRYVNSAVNVVSDDPEALRNIIVRRVLLPINDDLHGIILNKMHWKVPEDTTDYKAILQHFLLWKSLENAKASGDIVTYEAGDILKFPAGEMEKQKTMCETLIRQRDHLRTKIQELRSLQSSKKGGKDEARL